VIPVGSLPSLPWARPLALPAAMASGGLGVWLWNQFFGAPNHGLQIGSGFLTVGLPSAYYLSYGLSGSLAAMRAGHRRDGFASATLAVATVIILFVALYPSEATRASPMGMAGPATLPRGLVYIVGIAAGFVMVWPATAIGAAIPPVLGPGAGVLAVIVTFAFGAVASGVVAGRALAVVEAPGRYVRGRTRGHMAWMVAAAVTVMLASAIPLFPLAMVVALSGLGFHAYGMPILKNQCDTPSTWLVLPLCGIMLAWAAYVAMMTGPERFVSQYFVLVPW
jgi:hypothetical protein